MRTAPALLIVSLTVLALSGCITDDDPPVVDPEPTSTPIFASDEEALAAAEVAYGEYLAASNAVTSRGGTDTEPVRRFFSADYVDEAVVGYSTYLERNWHSSGSSTYDSASLQQYSDDGSGVAELVVYLCLDVSQLRILDSNGSDVTPDRDERLPLEISFMNLREFSTELVQTGSEIWPGEDFC